MKLFRWFRSWWRRHEPADDAEVDQVVPGPTEHINEPIPETKAPTVSRLMPDAFVQRFLEWTSGHALHGPTDVRRIEILMAEFCMDRLRDAIEIFARYRMSLICIRPT